MRSVESAANAAMQDGNLAPFRDALEKAKSTHVTSEDLAPYIAVHQDLQVRLQAVREIVLATKEKHQPKLQQALDKARTLRPFESDAARHGAESAVLKLMREGETGVHKMLQDAMQSGASVLSHLEAVAAVRSLLESSVSTEDKVGLEDVVTRGSALGMTREVEAARNALRAMDRIRIKCHLHTDIRILSIPRDTHFSDLKSKIEQTYGATSAFVMKYRDDVGDLITLASHEDLANALLTMDASVDTPAGSRKGSGPKLDVFLALPENNVRASLEGTLYVLCFFLHLFHIHVFSSLSPSSLFIFHVSLMFHIRLLIFYLFVSVKERPKKERVHPNAQLAASVQQLYELLSADSRSRATTPQPLPSYPNALSSSLSPPLPSSSLSANSPPLSRSRPHTSAVEPYPPHLSQHYDHLIDLNAEKEKNNKPAYVSTSNSYGGLTPMPPKTAKSSKTHKRGKSRESSDRLFVAGKSVNNT